ncbi:peptidoglycan-associated lipoprotein Pal [Marivibrio halodurans]|uniref:Peptidoglycan-associated lipoprotein n=1 Tax=Marivibrio halodurans TaxID=2039722 RepID=A0A8J7S2W6_9PROT|nr:peptidoglycan-associated lipoprotein Pal [Marivibrio halodurans]MBP5857684.1 peptidoglycan-associated lipoprotein Pal [Marivibrio halodurans]
MRVKMISLLAALTLVAACASEPEETADTSGQGSSETTTTTTTSEPTTSSAPSITPGSEEEFITEVGDRVFFALDSSELSSSARATLDRQSEWLQQYPSTQVVVEGHCDERGTREYNLALGERRANAVKEYLVSQGVDPNRVRTISYGKERPAVAGSTEAAWAQNRRGVTDIVSGAAS